MTKYQFNFFIRILLIVVFSILTGFLLSTEYYWLCLLSSGIFIYFIFNLFFFQSRTIKDVKRLISSIRFSEFNISFKNFISKGLSPEIAPELEYAINCFNNKIRKIEADQNFYDTLLNRIDFGVLVTDIKGNIRWINKAALDIFGKPQPHTISDLKNVSADLPEIFNKLIPHETKILKLIQDKKEFQLAVTSIYFSLDGKKLKIISLKNIQTVLEESESDAWKKLIRILTHEIMNSITPIISLADTFSGMEDNEETRELMQRAMETIHRRSKGLVDFVLNYQKLTRIPNPQKTVFQLKNLFEDISNLLNADNMNFTYSLQSEDMTIKADRTQIEQVMINLIKNACESSATKIPATVTVSAVKDNYQRTLIQVTDNGQGILPEILDKIFMPFFTTKTNGSGIGLSICRQIINLHGGSISIESEPEKGSVVSITL